MELGGINFGAHHAPCAALFRQAQLEPRAADRGAAHSNGQGALLSPSTGKRDADHRPGCGRGEGAAGLNASSASCASRPLSARWRVCHGLAGTLWRFSLAHLSSGIGARCMPVLQTCARTPVSGRTRRRGCSLFVAAGTRRTAARPGDHGRLRRRRACLSDAAAPARCWLALPAAAVALSPWTDLAMSGASVQANADCDLILTRGRAAIFAGHYLAGADPRHAYASPLYGNVQGLPPILMQVGTDEILHDDSRCEWPRSCAPQALRSSFEICDRMHHVWQLYARVLPEGRAACAHWRLRGAGAQPLK